MVVSAAMDGNGDPESLNVSTGMLGGLLTSAIVRTGDSIGDGCADRMVADALGMSDRLLVGSPSGPIRDETWRMPCGPGSIHGTADIVDFDADGELDIVALERGTRPGAYCVVRF